MYFIFSDDTFTESIKVEEELSYSNLLLKDLRLDEFLNVSVYCDGVLRDVEASSIHCFEK